MNYELTLSTDHVRMIIAALAELPYKMSSPAIESIMKQTDAQEKLAALKTQQDTPPAV
jgi:16S rRNA A1518/A1519 N6-dimethyltransferase RsmA/KsgA/DIM1 with predicted DNA glycosylase/AP lyase activity